MRKSRSLWQRCFTRNWSRKFVVVSVAVMAAAQCVAITSGYAEGRKKPAKNRGADKVAARKTDDVDLKAKPQLTEVPQNHPLKPVIQAAEESLTALKPVADYSSTLYKTEMVQGKLVEQTLSMKLRHEPFSVYLKFETLHAGEVIYVEGQNKGKLLAHETGFKAFAGTLSYLPTAKEVLVDNRYPITQVGMKKLLESLIVQWKDESQYQEVKVEASGSAKVGDTECRMLEVVHPQPREHYKFHITRLYVDVKTKFPIQMQQYGWPETQGGEPPLLEEYIYTNINTNLGLTDADFDKNNKAYAF